MALAQSGVADADEPRLLLKFLDIRATNIAHPTAQTAYQLQNHHRHRAAVGHAAFDSLRDQLGQPIAVVFTLQTGGEIALAAAIQALKIAVAGTGGHRRKRSHTAVCLERATLIKDGFARTLLGSGQQGANHHQIRTGGQSLGDVAGILDTAVGDDRNVGVSRGPRGFGDRRNLRHSGAGHDAGRAN